MLPDLLLLPEFWRIPLRQIEGILAISTKRKLVKGILANPTTKAAGILANPTTGRLVVEELGELVIPAGSLVQRALDDAFGVTGQSPAFHGSSDHLMSQLGPSGITVGLI